MIAKVAQSKFLKVPLVCLHRHVSRPPRATPSRHVPSGGERTRELGASACCCSVRLCHSPQIHPPTLVAGSRGAVWQTSSPGTCGGRISACPGPTRANPSFSPKNHSSLISLLRPPPSLDSPTCASRTPSPPSVAAATPSLPFPPHARAHSLQVMAVFVALSSPPLARACLWARRHQSPLTPSLTASPDFGAVTVSVGMESGGARPRPPVLGLHPCCRHGDKFDPPFSPSTVPFSLSLRFENLSLHPRTFCQFRPPV
jgi:hypothetical protein